ncbi:uncharacterized protein BDR25DRAFT_376025 [Lindgomyces ingoldianus]|uniref:Uncharacterized protein n=1 Tax=Lindgomyces ingoldianus TaxID=673940 RepID=A0ACB6QJK2_9PLEO|nr:uncharacterized protein BDR25DRAFT_376025 [Lindgomyces ingoldianus]KAF2467173.1 hypothetical protein BDR25DRAFT_376025 [Lindgomyces ingoldianus]
MFRRVEEGLPPDASYPADMKKLGYFINEAGHIRMIAYPDQGFQYHFSNQERHNEVHREAIQICWRQEVADRLAALGLSKLYLPTLTTTKPEAQPHIPILAPPAKILKSRKRVVVIINDSLQDLGILAYRQMQRGLGLNGGTIVNFAKEMVHRSTESGDEFDIFRDRAGVEGKEKDIPGLIVMNTGQLLYSHKYNEALTVRSWLSMPRKSICHESIKIHEVENRVEGHRTPEEHIKTVFDRIIKNPDFVAPDAEVYAIGIENGADYLLDVLNGDMDKYGSRITALALAQPSYVSSQICNANLKAFLRQRARKWILSPLSSDPHDCVEMPPSAVRADGAPTSSQTAKPSKPVSWLETLVPPTSVPAISGLLNRFSLSTAHQAQSSREPSYDSDDRSPICPAFAGGLSSIGECVFTNSELQKCILNFFEEVAQNPAEFRNPDFKVIIADPMQAEWEHAAEEGQGEDDEDAGYRELLPPGMSPEREEIDDQKARLINMKESLKATPKNDPELEMGRQGLEKRIVKAEHELQELVTKAMATGALKHGEAQEVRDKWETVGNGPKIPFAGTMVDSELVKGAGLLDTAEEALANLEEEIGVEQTLTPAA